MSNRLKDKCKSEVAPAMMAKFGYKNVMQIPRLEKIVINGGDHIHESAFMGYTALREISLPASIKKIENLAFNGCENLEAVCIRDLAAWCAIDFGPSDANPLRYAKKLYLKNELVSDLVIPEGVFDKTVYMSAMTGEGATALTDAIAELWGSEKISLSNDAVIWNARQKASLEGALDLLTAAADALRLGAPADAACTMVESALSSMGELDGRGVCEDIVGQVFARFCVGK